MQLWEYWMQDQFALVVLCDIFFPQHFIVCYCPAISAPQPDVSLNWQTVFFYLTRILLLVWWLFQVKTRCRSEWAQFQARLTDADKVYLEGLKHGKGWFLMYAAPPPYCTCFTYTRGLFIVSWFFPQVPARVIFWPSLYIFIHTQFTCV